MSNDKKTETKGEPQTVVHKGPEVPRGIAVQILYLAKQTQVPGHSVTDVVKSEKRPNQSQWEIEYLPAIRHHRITFTDPHRKETRVRMIHESHVLSWEPVAL